MTAFDWPRLLLDGAPLAFLGEVAFRAAYAFVAVFLFLRLSGRRGVRQLSPFEIVVILTLGSAAGDVSFYDDVPLLPVTVVFLTLLGLYRLTTFAMAKSPSLEGWLEGVPVVLVRDGRYDTASLRKQNFTGDEFSLELRLRGVEHLGQVELAILEVDGNVSVYFFADDAVRPGLSVLPRELVASVEEAVTDAEHACTQCALTRRLAAGDRASCGRCGGTRWSVAGTRRRVR